MAFLTQMSCLLLVFSSVVAEEDFLIIDGESGQMLFALGSTLDVPISPCSTFKIPLSLMGYDAGVLIDEQTPIWQFREGYDDFLDSWKHAQSPQSWMHSSCVWYSKLLSCQLGLKRMQDYLSAFAYGNQDLSAGIVWPGETDAAWLHPSALKISPREQVYFINSMLHNELGVTEDAIANTRALLFKDTLSHGWTLFGKTGWSGSIVCDDNTCVEYGWFVGWIENSTQHFPFAYLIRDKQIKLDQRIPRTIQLLHQSGIIPKV